VLQRLFIGLRHLPARVLVRMPRKRRNGILSALRSANNSLNDPLVKMKEILTYSIVFLLVCTKRIVSRTGKGFVPAYLAKAAPIRRLKALLHASAGNRTRGWPNHLRMMATANFTTKPPMLDGGSKACKLIIIHKYWTTLGKNDRSIFRLIHRSPGLIRHSVRLALERHVTTERFWTIGKWMAVFGIRYYLASGGRTLVYTKAIGKKARRGGY
jgi:hypothetical protein